MPEAEWRARAPSRAPGPAWRQERFQDMHRPAGPGCREHEQHADRYETRVENGVARRPGRRRRPPTRPREPAAPSRTMSSTATHSAPPCGRPSTAASSARSCSTRAVTGDEASSASPSQPSRRHGEQEVHVGAGFTRRCRVAVRAGLGLAGSTPPRYARGPRPRILKVRFALWPRSRFGIRPSTRRNVSGPCRRGGTSPGRHRNH